MLASEAFAKLEDASGHEHGPDGRFVKVPGGSWTKDAQHEEGNVELVPIKHLLSIKGNPLGKDEIVPGSHLAKVKAEIEERGLDKPGIINYDAYDTANARISLGEGNHRAQALHDLGYTHMPVYGQRGPLGEENGHSWSVPEGFVQHGYIPGYAKPSVLGVPTIPFPENKVEEGSAPKRPRTAGELRRHFEERGLIKPKGDDNPLEKVASVFATMPKFYKRWTEEEHPRDEYGKFTSTFSSGDMPEGEGGAAPGSPFAPGGTYHGQPVGAWKQHISTMSTLPTPHVMGGGQAADVNWPNPKDGEPPLPGHMPDLPSKEDSTKPPSILDLDYDDHVHANSVLINGVTAQSLKTIDENPGVKQWLKYWAYKPGFDSKISAKAKAILDAHDAANPPAPTGMAAMTEPTVNVPSIGGHKQFGGHKVADYEPWSNMEKVGEQAGSNPGGVYMSPSGEKFYTKFYANEDQGKNEALANSIYNALGLSVPASHLVEINGKKAIANGMVDGLEKKHEEDLATNGSVLRGFVADAFLANHDVVGTGYPPDNMLIKPDGTAFRVDNGGALKFRAMGGPKSGLTDDDVPELNSMRDPKYSAGKVFKHITPEQMQKQAKDLVNTLTDDTIDKLIAQAGFSGAEGLSYRKILRGRRDAIAKKFNIKGAAPEPETVTPAPAATGIKNPGATMSVEQMNAGKASAPAMSQMKKAIANFEATGQVPASWVKNPNTVKYMAEHKYTSSIHASLAAKVVSEALGVNAYKHLPANSKGYEIKIQETSPDAIPGDNPKPESATGLPAPGDSAGQSKSLEAALQLPDKWHEKSFSSKLDAMLSETDPAKKQYMVNDMNEELPTYAGGQGYASTAHITPEVIEQQPLGSATTGILNTLLEGGKYPQIEKHLVSGGKSSALVAKWALEKKFPGMGKASFVANLLSEGLGKPVSIKINTDGTYGLHVAWDGVAPKNVTSDPETKAHPDDLYGEKIANPNPDSVLPQGAVDPVDEAPHAPLPLALEKPPEPEAPAEEAPPPPPYVKPKGAKSEYDPKAVKAIMGEIYSQHGAGYVASNKLLDLAKEKLSEGAPDEQAAKDKVKAFYDAVDAIDPMQTKWGIGSSNMYHVSKFGGVPAKDAQKEATAKAKQAIMDAPPEALAYLMLKCQGTQGYKSTKNAYAKILGEAFGIKMPLMPHGYKGTTILSPDEISAFTGKNKTEEVPKGNSWTKPEGDEPFSMGPNHGDLEDYARRLSHSMDLPHGIAKWAPFVSSEHQQDQVVKHLRDNGHEDAANHLEAHYKAVRRAPEVDGPGITNQVYPGAKFGAGNPALAPSRLLHNAMLGEQALPPGVRPHDLYATDPAVREQNIQRLQGPYSENEGRDWLLSYYHERDLAAAGTHGEAWKSPNWDEEAPVKGEAANQQYGSHMLNGGEVPYEYSGGSSAVHAFDGASYEAPTYSGPVEHHPALPTHLEVKPGVDKIKDVQGKIAEAARSAFDTALKDHKANGGTGADPFKSLPMGPHGPSPAVESAHAYALTADYYAPLLQAARAALPNGSAMKALSKNLKSRSAVGMLTREAAASLCAKMGVDSSTYGEVSADIGHWIGNAQSPYAFKLRIATSMLRGIDPAANTHFKSSPERRAKVKEVCEQITPGYLKALLVHKAVTEAAAERHVNSAGTMPLVRGIGSKVGAGVLSTKKDGKVRLREQSMSGYTPNLQTAKDFAGDGHIIFRHVRPHEMWHSQMFSPSHGGCIHEMENMVHHTNGGGWVPHYENPAGIAPVGNMLSSQEATTSSTKIGQALRNFHGADYLDFSKGIKSTQKVTAVGPTQEVKAHGRRIKTAA